MALARILTRFSMSFDVDGEDGTRIFYNIDGKEVNEEEYSKALEQGCLFSLKRTSHDEGPAGSRGYLMLNEVETIQYFLRN